MAKGNGLFGNWRGTIGNVVGFITRSATGELEQGIRSKASQTTNVKSFGQAGIRLRMQPIQNTYRALKDIIDRGYEGVKYGPQSYQNFLKLAQNEFGGPYLVKGDKREVPGPFPISRGTLIPISITDYMTPEESANTRGGFVTDIFINYNFDFNTKKWKDLWSSIKRLNSDFKDGDQLTLVQCNQFGNQFVWRTTSLIVDPDDDRGFGQELPWIPVDKEVTGTQGKLVIKMSHNADETPVAFGIIQSRNGQNIKTIGELDLNVSNGNTKNFNLRSNCNIYVRNELRTEFMSSVAYQRSVATYMGTSLSEMDWPTIQIASEMYKATVLLPAPDIYTIPRSYAGQNVLGFITPTGGFGYFYKRMNDDGNLYLIDGNTEIIQTVDEGETVEVCISPMVQAPLLQWVYGLYQQI